MISSLHLKNFTAFTDLTIDFSPKVNIIIGENGTGKTQLLKAIYAMSTQGANGIDATNPGEQLADMLCGLYQPLSEQLGELRRCGTRGESKIIAEFAQAQKITAQFSGRSTRAKVATSPSPFPAAAIFVPTKEVLSLVRGLTAKPHDQATVDSIFDDGYQNLARMLIREGVEDLDAKVQLDPRFASIVPRLADLIGGRYVLESGRFTFQPGRYVKKKLATRSRSQQAQMYQDSTTAKFIATSKTRFSSGMTAEGFRKIGMLQRLLGNGSLNPGTGGPLLWDEPESNLNPKLMKLLVEILLELARNGQQIILATHDYVLLKWFDLLMDKGKEDHVRFHRLFRDENNDVVQYESQDDYSIIGRSAISDTFAELYDEDVKRALGEV